MSAVQIGQKAPDFTLETTQGTVTLSRELASSSRGVIIYFYPKASTPGCTKQACDFRDSLASLQAAGYSVIGVSADSMVALTRFAEKRSLTFPLASDPEHRVLEAYGAWGEKKNYGVHLRRHHSIDRCRGAGRHGCPGPVQREGDRPRPAPASGAGHRLTVFRGL